MEILRETSRAPVKAIVMDFDGTISTLRHGWEAVMRPMMIEYIGGGREDAALYEEVDAYIDESTGIQTILQMKWLAGRVAASRASGAPDDPWQYKREYGRRLAAAVGERAQRVARGECPPDNYLIAGTADFLRAVKSRGVKIYVASGTDHEDVVREAAILGVDGLFDCIAGAPHMAEDCSKEAVMRALIEDSGYAGEDIAVIGDGKVEIALGSRVGARTLGLATDEENRRGINPAKRERLISAGADAIAGDYLAAGELTHWLGI